ncbi:MAG: TIGR02281 family clan AA aspartic protease [Ectothiorhodospiraceae bacterium]|nr:TIGR02281 family clan AA aspartic protease [Ectothiorhodospiraceae bacterium]MCH8503639.1 TIGR02281 family clan AA aspartic protease [Ectothiorhodospiraceae bacterium]
MEQDKPTPNPARLGRSMIFVMWLVVLALLTLSFNSLLERRDNPNRQLQGQVTADGAREVTLERNRSGHYIATGQINGQSVTFLLDTGATDISIPEPLARRLGLERGAPVRYQTANGVITGYRTQLERVGIGPVELESVRASINPYMDGDQILLGMSFLRDLDFRQEQGRLTLRQPP